MSDGHHDHSVTNAPAVAVRLVVVAVWLFALLVCSTAAGQSTDPLVSAERQPRSKSPSTASLGTHDVLHKEAIRLDQLWKEARLEQFTAETLAVPQTSPLPPALARLRVESLLATGQSAAAEQLARRSAIEHAARFGSHNSSVTSLLKLWLNASLRQAQPLGHPEIDALLSQRTPAEAADGLETLRFWRQELAERAPYRLTHSNARPVMELKQTTAWAGLSTYKLDGIEVTMNDSPMPRVFIDTGGQHTLLTMEAAEAAGVVLGPESAELVGFSSFKVRPGLLKRLRLGAIEVHDVPVLVGDSPPLLLTKGQAALGIDLMQHVRFTIDYPRREVWAEPAAETSSAHFTGDAYRAWHIPLWTFSHSCLAEAHLTDGRSARMLIDTGNRVGTFASTRWARRRDPNFQGATSRLLGRLKVSKFEIPGLELGGRNLPNWPVLDVFPDELERLDAIDLLVGHDLLWQYRVIIDLRARMLTLEGGEPSPATAGQ